MSVEVSAPGRLCLFGEHQDFLGLSVIATAIDLDIRITASPRADSLFTLEMPDLKDRPGKLTRDQFDGTQVLAYGGERDYLRSATNVARKNGLSICRGYDCHIRGRIPMNAGTSSSSALTIAWISLLLATQEGDVDRSPQSIAWLGYLAEVEEHGEAGGMMDHYTSAVGNLLYIDCKKPVKVSPLPTVLSGFVLGDTGVPKNTVCTLRGSREATEQGVAKLAALIPGFDLKTTPLAQAQEHFGALDETVQRLVEAQFINRDLCQEARVMLESGQVDETRLGQMLYQHQVQLREGIGVSHPALDKLIDAAMEAGALGGKLNGSGCGGAMFAYAPGKQEAVAEAIRRAGGTAYIVNQRGGVSVVEI